MGLKPAAYDTNLVPTPSINQLTYEGAQSRLNNKKKKCLNADIVTCFTVLFKFWSLDQCVLGEHLGHPSRIILCEASCLYKIKTQRNSNISKVLLTCCRVREIRRRGTPAVATLPASLIAYFHYPIMIKRLLRGCINQ